MTKIFKREDAPFIELYAGNCKKATIKKLVDARHESAQSKIRQSTGKNTHHTCCVLDIWKNFIYMVALFKKMRNGHLYLVETMQPNTKIQ